MPCTSQYSGLPLPAGTTVADAIDVGFPGIVTKLGSVASAEHGIFAGIVGLTAASAREARISVLLTAWAPATPPAEIATATATASARVTAPRPAPAASGCLRVGNRFWNISLLSVVAVLLAPRLGGARLRCARPRGARPRGARPRGAQPRGAGVHPRARRARAAARHEAGAATPAIRTHLRTDGLRAISITALRNRSGPPPRRPIGSVSRYAGGGGASSWMPGGPPAAPLNLRHPGQLAPPGATRAAGEARDTRRSAGHRGPSAAQRSPTTLSAMYSAIARLEVAPGEGALRTAVTGPRVAIRKSSTSEPSASSACALTPAAAGTRSSAESSGR